MGIAFSVIISTHPANTLEAASDQQTLDELSERCGEKAEESFKGKHIGYDTKSNTLSTMTYEHHYNSKLNKCFMVTKISLFNLTEDKEIITESVITESLNDLNGNKTYGLFHGYNIPGSKPSRCSVLDKECISWDEWKALIKPYMEE